jgi:predicted HicB family RNase H-like nuclease
MSALTIRIPESLHQNLKALAEREGVSANQFVASGQRTHVKLFKI